MAVFRSAKGRTRSTLEPDIESFWSNVLAGLGYTAAVVIAALAIWFCLSMLSLPLARAEDSCQFTNVPDNVRAWFKAVKSRKGVSCCDIADGHRTDYDMHGTSYRVPINGVWRDVPDEAVVYNSGNPTGGAVVWYSRYDTAVHIRCFVPGGGA